MIKSFRNSFTLQTEKMLDFINEKIPVNAFTAIVMGIGVGGLATAGLFKVVNRIERAECTQNPNTHTLVYIDGFFGDQFHCIERRDIDYLN